MKKAVISCSGGMDSTSLLINLLANKYDEVEVINFNYGSKQNKVEKQRLTKNIKYLQKNKLPVKMHECKLNSLMGLFYSSLTDENLKSPEGNYNDESMKVTVVPNRNSIFAALLYGLALSISQRNKCKVDIALGIHSGDHCIYPDAKLDYLKHLYKTFAKGNWNTKDVGLYLPYGKGDKLSILKDLFVNCRKLDLNYKKILKNTLTCYSPDKEGKSCGKCGSCNERLAAFNELKITDPVKYTNNEDNRGK